MKRSLKKQVVLLARLAGGAHKTVHDRIKILLRFCDDLKAANIQITKLEHIKTRYIDGYIQRRLAQGIGKRTLQNEMAAIRCVLQQGDRKKLADSEQISNRALGINNASRAGTKTAITDEHYQRVLQAALAKDSGLAAAIQLARVMGLRSEEAVQSMHSLANWKKELAQGKSHLKVVFGTKGGRPRETQIINREQVQQAVNFALQVAAGQNGKLINKPDLKQAMNYWRSHCTRLGLTGKHAPHSLRYAWAQDAMRYYQQQGHCKKEVLALTSMSLGHGDGRGTYIAKVYGQ